MYFAGHESTAGTLAATLCLLASHKEEQDAVLEEIMTVSRETPDGTLGFDQYNSLIKTRSSFVEAVRMYPAGFLLIRVAREDTVLQVPAGTRADGTIIEEAIHIPKGTILAGDMIGARKYMCSIQATANIHHLSQNITPAYFLILERSCPRVGMTPPQTKPLPPFRWVQGRALGGSLH